MDKIAELKKLKALLDSGLVSQEEFNMLKAEILGIEAPKQEPLKTKELLEQNEPKVEPKVEQKKEPVSKLENVSLEKDKPNTSKTQEKADEHQKKPTQQAKKDKTKSIKEIKPKCKKCNKEISKYLDESNKGLCIDCKQKSVLIPKWAYLFLLLLAPLGWWILKDDTKNENPSEIKVDANNKEEQYFTINGDDIWVRNVAKTGDVVMKLNTNDRVKVLDSCCQESIKGNKSYWYQINYNGKQGWFFGSQTKEYQEININSIKKNGNPKDVLENLSSSILNSLRQNEFKNVKKLIKQDSFRFFYWDLNKEEVNHKMIRSLYFKKEYDENGVRVTKTSIGNGTSPVTILRQYDPKNIIYVGENYFPLSGFGGGSVSPQDKNSYVVVLPLKKSTSDEIGFGTEMLWFEYELIENEFSLTEIGNWELSQ